MILNIKKINKLIIIIILSLIVLITISIYYYVNNINYYGKIEVISDNIDSIYIYAYTPFNNKITLRKSDNNLFDNNFKPYKNIYIEIKNKGTIALIKFKSIFFEKSYYVNQNTEFSNKFKIRFIEKVFFLIHYLINNYLIYFLFFITILLILTFRKKIKKFLYFIKFKFINLINQKIKNKKILVLIFLIIFINLITGKLKYSNELETLNLPDQIEFHTIAVNLIKGYGFMIGGSVNNNINYKIKFNDNSSENKHKFLGGLKRLDRFPLYPLIISLLYYLFGVNPITVKYFNLMLLSITLFLIPKLLQNIFKINNYLIASISIIIIYFYLINYTHYISPDIISILINTIFIYLYSKLEKDIKTISIFILGLLLGLSFLIKASLMFFVIFIFYDLIFNYKILKQIKKITLFCFSFCLFWVPYNLWSISTNIKQKNESISVSENLKSCNNEKQKFIIIQEYTKKYYPYIQLNINNFEKANKYFQEEIYPNFLKYGYFNLDSIRYFNNELKILLFIELHKTLSKYYFIVQLPNITGLMDLNNEYVKDGSISFEWRYNKNSFYNNDNFSDKLPIVRVLNFYYHNPKYIFTIIHKRFISYFSNNFIIKYILVCGILLIFIKNLILFLCKKNIIILIVNILIIMLIPVILFYHEFYYVFLFFIILLLVIKFFPEQINSKIILFLLLNMYIFPIITYGNPRYLTYYDNFLFLVFGEILFLYFTYANFLISNLKFISK